MEFHRSLIVKILRLLVDITPSRMQNLGLQRICPNLLQFASHKEGQAIIPRPLCSRRRLVLNPLLSEANKAKLAPRCQQNLVTASEPFNTTPLVTHSDDDCHPFLCYHPFNGLNRNFCLILLARFVAAHFCELLFPRSDLAGFNQI